MISPNSFKVDFYCTDASEFPDDAPVGFLAGLVNDEDDYVTVYLFTGFVWTPIERYRTEDPFTKLPPLDQKNIIQVRLNPCGDTRTAPKGTTIEEFRDANHNHLYNVHRLMDMLVAMMEYASINHDHDKFDNEAQFYQDFKLAVSNHAKSFTKLPWYKKHIKDARHHLTVRCPEDVNLVDVIEMMVDIIAASAERTGEVAYPEIPDDIIKLAYNNTVALLKDSIVITNNKVENEPETEESENV